MKKIAAYVDVLRPVTERYALAVDAALVVGGSLIVALAAQVALRLPFSPVPVTGQTLAVLLVGAALGSKRGALSLMAYLLGPTGGYLVGFVAAAFVTGWLVERGWGRHAGRAVLAMLAGNAAIYLGGLSWLSLFAGRQALALGLLPFLAGDVAKIALGAALLPLGARIADR